MTPAEWEAFDRALAGRRREIVEGFAAFLRRDTVSQHIRLDHLVQGIRTTAGLLTELGE